MNTNDSMVRDDHSGGLDPAALEKLYRLTPISAAVLAAISPGAAVAQDVDEAKAGIEEIIVTATKREMPLQDVAQSIEAFSQEDIEKMVLNDMEAYTRAAPSATLTASRPGKNILTMRGISTSTEEWRTESRVAVYLDEQPITSISNQPDVRMVDIERVEILPGPQGTLLGSSSMSGAMRIITNKPNMDGFSGDVALTGATTDGGDPSWGLEGVLNFPLVDDKLAMRVVAYAGEEGGYIDNVLQQTPAAVPSGVTGRIDNSEFVGENQNVYEFQGGRVAALWKLSDKWQADFGAIVQSSRSDGTWLSDDSLGPYKVAIFHDEWREDDWWQVSATFKGDLGFAEFTSTTSYFERETAYEFDASYYNQWANAWWGVYGTYWVNYYISNGYLPEETYLGTRQLAFYDWDYEWGHWFNVADQTRFAQEFRLTSTTDSKFQWMLGAFYDDVYDAWLYGNEMQELSQTTGWYWANHLSCYYASLPNGDNWLCPLPETDLLYVNNYKKWIDQTAVFGEFDYAFTDKLIGTVGARWFNYDREENQRYGFPDGRIATSSYYYGYYSSEFTSEGDESDTLFKASLKYHATEDLMLYFTRSEGFRLGGSNPPRAVATGLVPATYESDKLVNYEIGMKSSWFDNRLKINFAAFKIEYDKIHVNTGPPDQPDPDNPGETISAPWWLRGTFNAGAAENTGFELNGSWLAMDNLKFEWSLYKADAEFTEDAWLNEQDQIDNPDEPWFTKGGKLAQSPPLKYRWAIEYTVPRPFGADGDLFFRYDESFQDEMPRRPTGAGWDDPTEPDYKVPSWSTGNLQAGMAWDNGTSLSLFVRNVWNEAATNYLSAYDTDMLDIPGNAERGLFVQMRTLQRPRTISLQFRKSF